MGIPSEGTAAGEWKANWPLILAASMGFSFYSTMLAAVGLFVEPLAREFGWSRTLISSGPSLAGIATAILSPFVGAFIDRYGARRVALPGLLVTMVSIAAFSLASGSAVQWTMLWLAFGIVSGSIKSTAWTSAVLRVFDRSRGLALGFTLSGTALAQIAVPPIANWLIEGFGWRASYTLIALGWGGLTFGICLLFFHSDENRAVFRRVGKGAITPDRIPNEGAAGLTPQEALRDFSLWRVGISNFVVMALTMGLSIHLFPILTGAGVHRSHAAWLLSIAGVMAVAGKLITGVLLDRFRPNWIGGITLGASALAFLLLVEGVRSPGLIAAAMMVNGYAAGTKTQITGYLTSAYGGLRHFGAIYGVMAALMALAAGVGPLVAGLLYDWTGGYAQFLLLGAIGCACSGVIMISLPAYPSFDRAPDPVPAPAH